MDAFENQLYNGLYTLLASKPLIFFQDHSLLIGFIAGVLALLSYPIKRVPLILMLLIAMLSILYTTHQLNIGLMEIFYEPKAYWIMSFTGNFITGNISGFIIANLIQRLREEHED